MKSRLISSFVLLAVLLTGCTVTDDSELEVSDETVTIVYAEPITDYSPFGYNSKDRKYLANIYDSLVRYDQSFTPDTALAVAWGRIDDLTWEFRLRDGVVFHDGSAFDPEDVLYSFDLARQDPDSDLGALLSIIESIEVEDESHILIHTYEPDPLLLNRLVNLYIVPENYEDFLAPNGTGPYSLGGFEDDTLILKRFDFYWGETPYFAKAHLRYEPSAESRYQAIVSGDADLLANVPPQYTEEMEHNGVTLVDYPSLETSFLMFNDSGLFSDPDLRSAAWSALNSDYASLLGGGYLIPTTQYASTGIMGFVSQWNPSTLDRILLDEPVELTLDLPEGIGALGSLIAEDLHQSGFIVTVNELDFDSFEKKIYSGESDLYFFGWKYDLADASEFYESVVHSRGDFNGTGYHNFKLDALIEEAARTLDLGDRRGILEEIATLYYEDQVAFPLFESKVLYGVRDEIHWTARLDGLILASEIRKNMVE